jgi:SSS family solute:Na+ symporter
VAATLGIATLGSRGKPVDAAQFVLGGRSFGTLFLWLLLAGEIYTSFTFLGAAGWAYGKGAPAFYILCYGTVAYVFSYFLLPRVWRIARERNLFTGPDFFASQYQSRWLGSFVALVGFAFLVPYATLQLTGVQVLLEIAGYGTVGSVGAVGLAFALVAIFVYSSGLRGTARASVVKDVLVLAAVVFAGIALPIRFFGSPAGALDRVLALKPDWLVLAGPGAPNGTTWFVTTVILTACGFYMFPQSMAAIYSAENEDVLRRNAILLPFYQLMLLLVYFAGFSALVIVPGLHGAAADRSFMLVVQHYYPPWALGLVAGAGVLAGLVPASAQVLAAASVIAKNVFLDYGLVKSDAGQTRATRLLVLAVAALAFLVWAFAKTTLVGLLLVSYNGVTQFFPGVILSFSPRTRPTAVAVAAGICAGLIALAAFAARGISGFYGVNIGFAALGCNLVGLALAQAVTVKRSQGSDAL